MKSTFCLLKSGGLFKADGMFLIEKGACAVVEGIAFHLERERERVDMLQKALLMPL